MYGSAAEDKRRDDRYRSMMTLNDLKPNWKTMDLKSVGVLCTLDFCHVEAIQTNDAGMSKLCRLNLSEPKMIFITVIQTNISPRPQFEMWNNWPRFFDLRKSFFCLKTIKLGTYTNRLNVLLFSNYVFKFYIVFLYLLI